MKVILVDDEPIALEVFERMLDSYEDIDIVGKYTQPLDALKSIEKVKPDVIFLDIEMGKINGLELAESFLNKLDDVQIVFVTAYSEYAVDAFEINAIDYLLKPVQQKRLYKAIKRVKEKMNRIYPVEESELKELEIYSFGGFQVLDNKGHTLTWRTQKSKELLAYLWYKKKGPVPRDLIIENIFPDRDREKATTLLHTTIYQLRKRLRELGYIKGISYFNEGYRLDIPITSDLEKLNILLDRKEHQEQDIMQILQIYKGDFFEEGYHWAIEMQQVYRKMILSALERFIEKQIKNKDYNISLKICLDKANEIDPLNDNIVEKMIHYYGTQEERTRLETFYNDYVESLWDETNLDPEENIVKIYNQYMKGLQSKAY